MIYGHLAPGRYLVGDDGVARKALPQKQQVLQGWACHYNVEHTNYKTDVREIFLPGCFAGSLTGLLFLRDHLLSEKAMADQDDGDLEVHDCEAGLAMRVHLKDGVLDRLEGRDQLSVGYHLLQASLRSDGVLLIKSAVLLEISACYVGAVRQVWSEIRNADDVGSLADDAKTFASEGASRGFLRELRKLQ
ncbi:hypothetical protein [Bradyrhizobium erythrophlei]|uniref:Prohead serine protease n=1 Tax=Bradyrhizobium erythrophlei TaxID=1437360 RepID=A0A1M5LX16_9BRAD|nr:hypothetical protein [Bradyrhizobium erythrophlei]SHG69644.1 prohead serine protease [Bradyrhizobium erythrophlei]